MKRHNETESRMTTDLLLLKEITLICSHGFVQRKAHGGDMPQGANEWHAWTLEHTRTTRKIPGDDKRFSCSLVCNPGMWIENWLICPLSMEFNLSLSNLLDERRSTKVRAVSLERNNLRVIYSCQTLIQSLIYGYMKTDLQSYRISLFSKFNAQITGFLGQLWTLISSSCILFLPTEFSKSYRFQYLKIWIT